MADFPTKTPHSLNEGGLKDDPNFPTCTREQHIDFFRKAEVDQDGYLNFEEFTNCLRRGGYRGLDVTIKVQ